jgi:hypothetical protein
MATIGGIRARSLQTTNAIGNIQYDSLSTDPNLNSEVAVLNKVNATNVLSLQNAQDTNKLLVAILEQQTILSKQLRDSATNIANADIDRRQNSANLNQQLTGSIGQSLSSYTLPSARRMGKERSIRHGSAKHDHQLHYATAHPARWPVHLPGPKYVPFLRHHHDRLVWR